MRMFAKQNPGFRISWGRGSDRKMKYFDDFAEAYNHGRGVLSEDYPTVLTFDAGVFQMERNGMRRVTGEASAAWKPR